MHLVFFHSAHQVDLSLETKVFILTSTFTFTYKMIPWHTINNHSSDIYISVTSSPDQFTYCICLSVLQSTISPPTCNYCILTYIIFDLSSTLHSTWLYHLTRVSSKHFKWLLYPTYPSHSFILYCVYSPNLIYTKKIIHFYCSHIQCS